METKFQTSFIPRKSSPVIPGTLGPQVPKRGHDGTGIFLMVAIIVLVCSLLSVGGMFAWKQYLLSAQSKYETSLIARQKDFKLDQISLMRAQATKITLAKRILNSHLTTSKIFSVISGLTSESVRFLTMDLTIPTAALGPFQLTLSGYGKDLPSVAFQSDILNQLEKYGLRMIVKNALVSDPALNRNGTVSFGFSAQIDPETFYYTKNLDQSALQNSANNNTSTQN